MKTNGGKGFGLEFGLGLGLGLGLRLYTRPYMMRNVVHRQSLTVYTQSDSHDSRQSSGRLVVGRMVRMSACVARTSRGRGKRVEACRARQFHLMCP